MHLVALALILAVPQAVGDPCHGGKVIVDEAGHCCWEEQGWSPNLQACVGRPRCPAGTWPRGETCVEGVAEVESAPRFDESWLVPVRFVSASEGETFQVSVDDKHVTTCTTPCEVRLTRGRHRIYVHGPATFGKKIDVRGSAAEVRIERRSNSMLAMGVVSIAAGGLSAVVGANLALYGALLTSTFDSPADRANKEGLRDAGLVMLVVGATVAVVGGVAGLTGMGHNRMDLVPERSASALPDGLRLQGLAVAPTQGGAMAGATFSF